MSKSNNAPEPCGGCGTLRAVLWGVNGRTWCSVCIPADDIAALTEHMEPAARMGLKRAMLKKGNKALLERTGNG